MREKRSKNRRKYGAYKAAGTLGFLENAEQRQTDTDRT